MSSTASRSNIISRLAPSFAYSISDSSYVSLSARALSKIEGFEVTPVTPSSTNFWSYLALSIWRLIESSQIDWPFSFAFSILFIFLVFVFPLLSGLSQCLIEEAIFTDLKSGFSQ